jgi:hypothetical protein
LGSWSDFGAFGELLEGFWEALKVIWEPLGGPCLFFGGLLPENGFMTTFLIILGGLGLIFGAFGDPLEGFWESLGVIWEPLDGPWPFCLGASAGKHEIVKSGVLLNENQCF